MKILLLVRDLRPGGVPSLVGPLAREFTKAGHEVTIYNQGLPSEIAEGVMQGVRIVSGGRADKGGYRGHLEAFRRWKKFVHEYDPDVLQSHVGLPDIYASVTKVDHKTVKVRAALAPQLFPHQPYFGWFFERLITPWAFDHHVAVSQGVRKSLISTGIPKDKIRVIFNPISERILGAMIKAPEVSNAYKQLEKAEELRIGYLGRLSREKGPDRLIRWFKELITVHGLKAKLFLAGSGIMEAELEQLAIDLNIADNVVFLGYVPNPSEILPQFHLVVSPSRYEGLPIALLEAAAMGCSIAATETDGAMELKGLANELLMLPNRDHQDRESLSKLASWVSSNPIAKNKKPNLTPVAIEKIKAQSIAREYLKLYEELLQNK